jgi:GDP-L-fucose synthase
MVPCDVVKILITGASGMLGSAIQRSIPSDDFEILAPSSKEMNLTDPKVTLDFLTRQRPDIIFHCAAKVGGIQANIREGSKFLTTNVMIDHNLLFSAAQVGVPKLIYVGSSCMYPANQESQLKESDLLSGSLEPTNESYALSKILGSKLCTALSEEQHLRWSTIIASNLFGMKDNFNPDSSHLLASIITKVQDAKLNNRKSIPVWGDGNNRREFTYVDDFADFLVRLGTSDMNIPKVMNAGVGIDYTVKEWYEMVMQATGIKLDLNFETEKPQGNRRKLMDSSIAHMYGWNPQTDVRDAIQVTTSWYLRNLTNA